MKLAPPSQLRSLNNVGAWARQLIAGIGASWAVEHTTRGTHRFTWNRPTAPPARFLNWTVTAITLYKYEIVGSTMRLVFDITGTLAGTPVAISVPIPDGYQSRESCSAGSIAYTDAGTPGTGDPIAVADRIDCYKTLTATAWTAGTARVQGTISFEVA